MVEIDVNMGKWEQLITERHDAFQSALSAVELVFDFPDHDDDEDVDLDQLPDDSQLELEMDINHDYDRPSTHFSL